MAIILALANATSTMASNVTLHNIASPCGFDRRLLRRRGVLAVGDETRMQARVMFSTSAEAASGLEALKKALDSGELASSARSRGVPVTAFFYRTPLVLTRAPGPPPPSPPPPPPDYEKVAPEVVAPKSPRDEFGIEAVMALIGSLAGAAVIFALVYVFYQMRGRKRDTTVSPETKDRWIMDEFRDQAILAIKARADAEAQGLLPAPAPVLLLSDKAHEEDASASAVAGALPPKELTVLALPAPALPSPGAPERIPRPFDPTAPAALAAVKYDVAGNPIAGARSTITSNVNPYRDGPPQGGGGGGGAFSLAAYSKRPAPPKRDDVSARQVGIALNDRLAAKIRAGDATRDVVAAEESAHASNNSWARSAQRPARDRSETPVDRDRKAAVSTFTG